MSPPISMDRLPRYVTGLGVLLGAEMLIEVLLLAGGAAPEGTDVIYAGLATSIPFVAGLLYGGYRLKQSRIDPDRYARIGQWMGGGMLVFLAVNVAIMPTLPIRSELQFVGWLRWAIGIGATVGLLIGGIEARAIHREVLAERGKVSADRRDTRRTILEYFDDRVEPAVRRRLDAMEDIARDIDGSAGGEAGTEIVRHVRGIRWILIHADKLLTNESGPSPEPINLRAVLNELSIERSRDPVDIDDGEMADDCYVVADRLLEEAIDQLLGYLQDRVGCSRDEIRVRSSNPGTVSRCPSAVPGHRCPRQPL